MAMNQSRQPKKGFTLIVILAAVALGAILLGVIVVVFDLPSQGPRSRQVLARSNLDKACMAFVACILAQTDGQVAGRCDSFSLVGALDPSGKFGLSTFTLSATGLTVIQDGCRMSCNTTGAVTLTPVAGGVCYKPQVGF